MSDLGNEYESIEYVSEVLWHFIKDSHSSKGIDILFEKIIQDDGEILLKKNPNPESPLYHDKGTLELARSETNNFYSEDEIPKTSSMTLKVFEPKSICFADIPIQSLPKHWKNGYGETNIAGISIRKSNASFFGARPVMYVPKINFDNLNDFIEGKICEKSENNSNIILRNFVKTHTSDEKFEQIYLEREWRTQESEIIIPPGFIENIVVKTKEAYAYIQEKYQDKFRSLTSSGVSFFVVNSLFGIREERISRWKFQKNI